MRKGKNGKKTTTVFKKKVDKVKAAKAKLKQMQKSGFWGAPPRRAASLNAAAMVHFMYDNEQIQPKMAISPPTKATTSGVVGNAVENSGGSKEANSSSPSSKTTTKSPKLDSNLKKKQSNTKSKQTAASSEDEDKMLSTKLKTSSASNTNKNNSAKINNKNHNQPIYSSDENSSSNSSSSDSSDDDSDDDDRGNHNKRSSATKANSQGGKKGQQTAKNKAKKKKSLKDEFQMDIKDMIVKKRLASLNASAIMSASYAQERPKDAQGKKDGRGHPGSVVTGIYHSEL